jgi:hypothetical protein
MVSLKGITLGLHRGPHYCLVEDAIYQVCGGEKTVENVSLGPYRRWNIRSACPACQRYKYLLPSPVTSTADEDVVVRRGNSMRRLEPAILADTGICCEGYADLAYLSIRKYDQDCHLAPDVVFVDGQKAGLTPRMVNPVEMDAKWVRAWINLCIENHGETCREKTSPELSMINLIDVKTRRVVTYSIAERFQNPVEYLCLSYVWGTAQQQILRSGNKLLAVPNTIEDAMAFTQRIGQTYLWVDSVSLLFSNSHVPSNDLINFPTDMHRSSRPYTQATANTDYESDNSKYGL